jgi:hypothetical protein
MAYKSKKQGKLNRKKSRLGRESRNVSSSPALNAGGTINALVGLKVYSKECSGKNGYELRADAKKHARRVPGNRVYKCHSCELFHVGHSTAVGRQQMREVEWGEHERRESCTLRE